MISTAKKWNDKHFVWNASEYGNITTIIAKKSEIWSPKINTFDKYGQEEDIADDSRIWCRIRIGKIQCIVPANKEGNCTNNSLYWPYDEQICDLYMGYSDTEEEKAKLVVSPHRVLYGRNNNGRQYISAMNVTTMEHNLFGKNYTKIVYSIKVKGCDLKHSPMFLLPAISKYAL